ncbi:UPF0182 family protein [Ornithinimicrobium faecis]|uniref:UPF0182 protein NF556_05285 n=2 Tax=Ornithinimicrobium faecis TaxID=2934158 RepID=A0ABY4YX84_9MICO|nr:UPF0182 family protein [Ornithinimicrobium sp. HY1793]USQ81060.1 UPF0182 family protein [Ornithinimicrobium sp. HY1793]
MTERDGTTPEEPADDSAKMPRDPWERGGGDPFGMGGRGDDSKTPESGPGGGGKGGARPPAKGGRGRFLPTVLILVAVLTGLTWLAQLWTEFLWYESVGYRSVLTTRLLTQVALFVGAGLITGLLVWSSLHLAYRNRPIYAPSSPEQINLDRYRAALDPVRKLVFIGAPILLALFAGSAMAAQWQTVLLWLNRQPFGVTDPQFNIDVGFFVFTMPWLNVLVSFATLILGLAIIAALMVHYIYGGVQLQGPGDKTTPAARIHLSILLALIVGVRALAFWLERYGLATAEHGRMTGMTYTDVNAVLPTRGVLAIAAILCALLFLSTIWTRNWRLPLIGLAGLVVIALLVGGAYPALVQSLRVKPSEAQLEEPFIQRNIESTLAAYDLESTEVTDYEAETEATEGQLREDADTVPGIRIVDPAIVSDTFRQLQGFRNYYQFPDALDVDRYEVDGESADTVVAVRELRLDGIPAAQRNWVNDHTVYTHGFGLVAAYGNQRSEDGEPIFYQRNIPPVGELGDFEPRIYFGEHSPSYSIVGAPDGATPRELDFPDSANTSGETRNTYSGGGGVDMGSFPRQLAYAIKYRQVEILLSDSVGAESRMIDHREPRERVERVAPWLRLDGNPYPAVVDGRVKWIVDGYTTSSQYPYSELEALGEVTTDSLVASSQNVQSIGQGDVNYIRNSVKATVDAYDGEVTLFAWDEEDPLLKAWSSAFDNTVQPMSEISGELMSHLRYPEDLFKVQREVMGKYHVDTAEAFFGGQDFWEVSADESAAGDTNVAMPPYYLSIAMPGQDEPTFSLTSTYIPGGERQNLVGYLAVDADAGSTAGEKRDGYGQMRLLELPRDSTVTGPGQFQNEIETSNANSEAFNQTLSQFLTLNRTAGSEVEIGNLLTLPVGGGMLYVEPVYVRASGGSSYPLQRLVVVSFGNQLAWSDTLDGALDELFGGDSGATAADEGTGTDEPIEDPVVPPVEGEEPPGDDEEQTEQPPADGEEPTGDLADAVADIQTAYADGQEALRNSDWEAYAEAQQRLDDAIARAVELAPEGGSVSVDPTDDNSGATATP